MKQHKVTVIGDIVDPYTLLRKLTKAGKHAELWPVKVKENQEPRKSKEKEKPAEEQSNEIKEASSSRPLPPAEKPEQVLEPSKITREASATVSVTKSDQEPPKSNQGGAAVKVTEVTGKTCTVDQVPKEVKLEEKKPENNGTVAAQPAAEEEKKGGESDTTADGGGKKMKKKGQNGNNSNNNSGGEESSKAPANIGSQNHEGGPPTGSVPPNHSLPHHPSYYAYPPHYYGPPIPIPTPPPVYAVSYNTSQPASHTASYYAGPPPDSYVYAYSGGVPERQAPPPPPSDLDAYPRQPLDSFEIFSDENPNGCSVM